MEPKSNNEVVDIPVSREISLQAAVYRLGNIDQEIQEAYSILRKYPRTVTVFGSARTSQDDPYYDKARQVGAKLAEAGYTVITGGGHGIMEAANRGAIEAGGKSIGFNIRLPHEQTLNEYTTESLSFTHFAPRKIAMTLYADAFVYFPGGFGTIDELGEILTLIETGKTSRAPVILYGKDFWQKFDEFVTDQLLNNFHTVSPHDQQIYKIVDNVDQVVNLIRAGHRRGESLR